MIISEQWPDLLEAGLKKIFINQYDDIPTMTNDIFSKMDSTKSQEKFSSAGVFPSISAFTGKVDYSSEPVQGYDKTVSFTEYAGGFTVERKLAADDLYNIVSSFPENFAIAIKRFRETMGADVFNRAFTYTPTDGDAQPLCSNSHPSTADASYAGDNLGTTALSATAVSTARLAMRKYTDDQNGKIYVMGDTILAPIDLEETAWEIINSRGKVDTANNNANFLMGKYKLLVWPFLSDTNNWFMMDSSYMKKWLHWIDREPVQFFKDKDSDTLVAKYAAYFRMATAWIDWRFIYGSNVS